MPLSRSIAEQSCYTRIRQKIVKRRCAIMIPRQVAVLLCFVGCAAAVIDTVGATTSRAQEPQVTVAELEQRLATYRRLLSDWGGLTRYGSEDSELKAPAAGEQRVVFLGDQVTESWGSSAR